MSEPDRDLPRLEPASFVNNGGDVSWEFRLPGPGPGEERVVRGGVRLPARHRLLRMWPAGAGGLDATEHLIAHAAAAVLLAAAPADAAGVVWVTPHNLERVAAFVRERRARARPLYRR